MKMKELKTKSDTELSKLITEKREALRAFRFNISGGKAKNVKEGRNLRADIARAMTELSIRTK